jgi:hypothetical protein
MKSSRKLPLLVLLALSVSAVGQKKVTDFLKMGKDAAGIMTKEYLRPYGEMLGKSLNGGWYNSASIHKLGGFDFNAGLKLQLGFLALYGDYTFGDYSMLSAGLGISFR